MRSARFKYGVLPFTIGALTLGVVTPSSAAPMPDEPAMEDVRRATSSVTVGETTLSADEFGIVSDVVEVADGESAVLQSFTLKSSGDLPVLTSLTTHESVQLSWDEVTPATTYTLLRDGEQIATTTDEEFLDTSIQGGENYTYVVEALTPADQAAAPSALRGVPAPLSGPEVPAQGASEYDPSLEASSLEDAPDPVIIMSTEVTVPAESSKASASDALTSQVAAAAAANSSIFRHTTFIPGATAGAFPCRVSGYFGGDNRGFSMTSPSFRTRLDANINWLNNGAITQNRQTANTSLYNSNGTLNSTRNAGVAGMGIYIVSQNSVQVRFNAEHSVGNPFCAAGAISYNWNALVYRSGTYSISGTYRPAPNHEIYLRTGTLWRTVFAATNQGFECLTGVCGLQTISRSTL